MTQRDALYTARWYASKIIATSKDKTVISLAREQYDFLTEQLNGKPVEKPTSPSEIAKKIGSLAIVVGHTKTAQGARAVAPLNEYEYVYNKDIAYRMQTYAKTQGVTIEVFLRDGRSIAQTYQAVRSWDPHAVIELHFNAATEAARGCEILLSTNRDSLMAGEKQFAEICLKAMYDCFEFQGKHQRGLKEKPSSTKERGWQNVNQIFARPSILVEPFFGSNPVDAALAHGRREQYARSLVDSFVAWKAL